MVGTMTQGESKPADPCPECARWQAEANKMLDQLQRVQADVQLHRAQHAALTAESERLREELSTTAGLIEAVAERALAKAAEGRP